MIFSLTLIYLSLIFSHPKGDELRKKTLSSDGVIVFTAQTFKEFVMKHPRPYDVVILFTLKIKCNLCEAVKTEFAQVAESYKEFDGYKPDKNNRKRAVFFGILYYSDETNAIFKNLKLPSTTSILYTNPYNIQLDENNEPFIKYDEDFVIGYKERSDAIYAHKILEFANAKSGRKIELKKNPFMFILYFLVFVVVLMTGYAMYNNFKQIFLSPHLWLIGSFLVYVICIGGIVYNIIHGTPFAKTDREGNIVEWIHSGQRSQYVGEGLIMSSLFVITGTLLMAFNWINGIKGYWPHRIASLVLIFLIAIMSRIITSIYQKKASWYGPTFLPPSGYIQGPLIKDQGNSF
jgi:oligosaccharyltransferase complex subunit gamma